MAVFVVHPDPDRVAGLQERCRRLAVEDGLDGADLGQAGIAAAAAVLDWLRTTDTVLGVLPDDAADLDPAVRSLLDDRVAAREARDWAASDRLRDELAALGIAVEDTRDGQRWRRLVEAGRD